ncbi:MAG: RidA family protein [Pelagibacterales bacterium]|jgi:enamine deaminase RidA (YjgF/YER057c/UK114 family)|nr:RidA family protein [Pelagibacterales bacterium]
MDNKIIHPVGWKASKGYANGILSNNGQLFIGGQIGWTADKIFKTHTFIGQMEQALSNIVTIVEAAGGGIKNIVRLTWYIKNKNEYLNNQKHIGEIYQKILGKHYPAMSMLVVKDLIEDEALLEIEATAIIS